jgi:hypothetical protein
LAPYRPRRQRGELPRQERLFTPEERTGSAG